MRVPAAGLTLVVLATGAVSVRAAEPAMVAGGCPDSGLQPYPGNLDRVAGAIVCEINVRRAEAGLHLLRRERRLDRSSQFHSDDMVESRFVAHEQPGHPRLVTRIRRTGYFARVADALYTENVAVAPQEDGTAANLVTAWMLSDRHRANILFGRFREIGVGARITGPDPVFYADRPSVVYTTDFGRRYWRRGTRCARRSLAGQASPPRRYCTRRRAVR